MVFDPKSVSKVYQNNYDLKAKAEIEYERLRSLNKKKIIAIDLENSIKSIAGSLSVNDLIPDKQKIDGKSKLSFDNTKKKLISQALLEARRTVLARGVGPLEDLPLKHYVGDSVRFENVSLHTQIREEHKLIAKYTQMNGNRWNPDNSYNDLGSNSSASLNSYVPLAGIPGISELGTVVDNDVAIDAIINRRASEDSKIQARSLLEKNINKSINVIREDGTQKTISNTYKKGAQEYTQSNAIERVIRNSDGTKSIFPFRITNLARGGAGFSDYESFPATISTINETISPTWNSVSLLNRSEDIYLYDKAERSFNLEFKMFCGKFEETPSSYNDMGGYPIYMEYDDEGRMEVLLGKREFWRKISFLHSLSRPSYVDTEISVAGTSVKTRRYNKAPYCRLTIGNLFVDATVVFDSLNLTYGDTPIWDINSNDNDNIGIRPMYVDVTLAGKILKSVAPSANDFDFYL